MAGKRPAVKRPSGEQARGKDRRGKDRRGKDLAPTVKFTRTLQKFYVLADISQRLV